MTACSDEPPTGPLDSLSARDEALTAALADHVIYVYDETDLPALNANIPHVHIHLLNYRRFDADGGTWWAVVFLDGQAGLLRETALPNGATALIRQTGQWRVEAGELVLSHLETETLQPDGTWATTTNRLSHAPLWIDGDAVNVGDSATDWTLAPLAELPTLLAGGGP